MSIKDMKPFAAPLTLTETIYQHLKQSIADGVIQPGQRLQEKEIAEKFQISVTPVREAFLRLSAEGYLVNSARHEVLVSSHSAAEAMDLYEIVRVLDLHILKRYIKAVTAEQINELKKMTAELGRYFEENDNQKYMLQNFAIHDRIWQAYENKAMYNMLAEITEKINVFRLHNHVMPFSDPTSFKKSYADHLKLVECIEKKDLKNLKALVLSHWGEELIPKTDEQA